MRRIGEGTAIITTGIGIIAIATHPLDDEVNSSQQRFDWQRAGQVWRRLSAIKKGAPGSPRGTATLVFFRAQSCLNSGQRDCSHRSLSALFPADKDQHSGKGV